MREEFVSQLNKVYNKYYGENNKCCYYSECKSSILDCEEKFLFDKANVGKEYGNNPNIPRIVAVGLEGLGKKGIVSTVEVPSDTAYNPHYKGVRYVVAYVLRKCAKEEPPANSLKKELRNYNDAVYKYALLNCYKCAFSKRSTNLPHTEAMKEHCQKILFDEIRVLRPDFVIVQMKSNRPHDFEENFREKLGFDEKKCIAGDENTGVYQLIRNTGESLFLIWTYHGSGSPDSGIRSWTNDTKNGFKYINNSLNYILDKAVSAYLDEKNKQK